MKATGKSSSLQSRDRIMLVDCDGTICFGNSFTPEDCMKAIPNKKMIKKVNQLRQGRNFIVIYTARDDELIPATIKWLRKHGVRYHAISNEKIPGNYVDNRGISIKDFLADRY